MLSSKGQLVCGASRLMGQLFNRVLLRLTKALRGLSKALLYHTAVKMWQKKLSVCSTRNFDTTSQ